MLYSYKNKKRKHKQNHSTVYVNPLRGVTKSTCKMHVQDNTTQLGNGTLLKTVYCKNSNTHLYCTECFP
jgi:hypothetical protein